MPFSRPLFRGLRVERLARPKTEERLKPRAASGAWPCTVGIV
ncbi:MAG: hypothetical protein BLITH_1527 [Brockia lithotrophica]|uniref:Uncharacterized protein n=1 Tax=Brockia lithotrophica TaxID=933949 RepID=A0A2T5G5J0_9BACL|nr:MAG: hypothetical protein BLITH_1527 [Brockia lithotrophica]